MARRTSIEFLVKVPDESLSLPAGLSTAMFRIAQEALTNVVRHASASRVDLIFEASDTELALTIWDDGVGIDSEKPEKSRSLGLVGMRERAASLGGDLTVEPGTQGGTRVFVRVPLVGPQQPSE
jgi:signal transduction histidine kinase